MEKLKLSIKDIVELTGESKRQVFAAIAAGDLDTFKSGRRRFARPAAVKRWVDYIEAQSKAGRPVLYQTRKRHD